VISPQLRTHGLDSPSFATLCALVAGRDTAPRHEVHLLHDAGRVLSVVDSVAGRVAAPADVVTDAVRTAQALREQHGADRAIVADAVALREMYAAVEATVTPRTNQPALLLAHQQAFRDCAGVVADPPLPPVTSWRALEQRLRDAGDGTFLIAAGTAPSWQIALWGCIRDGVITDVTDLPPAAVDLLPALYAVPALLGERIAVALVTSYDGLRAILGAADVARAILDNLSGPVEVR
jgi:hypothetical protein